MSAPICIYHWQAVGDTTTRVVTVTTLLHANISDVSPMLAVKHMCRVVLVRLDISAPALLLLRTSFSSQLRGSILSLLWMPPLCQLLSGWTVNCKWKVSYTFIVKCSSTEIQLPKIKGISKISISLSHLILFYTCNFQYMSYIFRSSRV